MRSSPTEAVSEPQLEVQAVPCLNLPVLAWDLASGGVWWSESMYLLHGRRPAEVEPSLLMLLDHMHPDDRERADLAFERISRDGRPFAFEHRLVTASRQIRTVILFVSARLGAAGRPEMIMGTSLDVSEARRIHHAASEETVSGLQAEITRLNAQLDIRDVVGHAAGVLMERHKISAEEAAAVLRRGSQIAGRKLYDVASELLFSGRLPAGATATPRPPKPRPSLRPPATHERSGQA